MSSRPFPPASPHGELQEVFPDVFFVTGSVNLAMKPLSMRFSRNMTVLRHDGALTLINTVRLNEQGLAALDALGKVEHIVRVAGFHGMDDPFYKDRYGARVWCVQGQVYAQGFDNLKSEPQTYFAADESMDAQTELPCPGAKLVLLPGKVPEAVLLLERDGGILVTGDSLQNWATADRFFSLPAKLMMRMMGFIKPHNLGPGWLKQAQPDLNAVRGLLDLPFDHVLPAHGQAVVGGARQAYEPVIRALPN